MITTDKNIIQQKLQTHQPALSCVIKTQKPIIVHAQVTSNCTERHLLQFVWPNKPQFIRQETVLTPPLLSL